MGYGRVCTASGGSTEAQGGAAAPPLAGKPWKKLKIAPLLVCPPCARHNASKMFSQFAAPTTHSAIGFARSETAVALAGRICQIGFARSRSLVRKWCFSFTAKSR
ncbi:hypothetical protein L3X38_040128 [Prunus dulcis]|uniref:Uncharacterized protein n=1 Tax=Prunus dulcis TaxID=3755 RepID=A0AAD4V8E9_PRUDU|nr:hypothetical protein L3X38_040128 [Prunus dulcis]